MAKLIGDVAMTAAQRRRDKLGALRLPPAPRVDELLAFILRPSRWIMRAAGESRRDRRGTEPAAGDLALRNVRSAAAAPNRRRGFPSLSEV